MSNSCSIRDSNPWGGPSSQGIPIIIRTLIHFLKKLHTNLVSLFWENLVISRVMELAGVKSIGNVHCHVVEGEDVVLPEAAETELRLMDPPLKFQLLGGLLVLFVLNWSVRALPVVH